MDNEITINLEDKGSTTKATHKKPKERSIHTAERTGQGKRENGRRRRKVLGGYTGHSGLKCLVGI